MNNRLALIVSGVILMLFFIAGLLDIMYELGILENLVTQLIFIVAFIGFIVYLIKTNLDRDKKNLP